MKVWNATVSRMRCMATMRVLQSYLDGALDEVTAQQVAEHLEDCRRCGLEAEVYHEIKIALGQQDRTIDPQEIERLRHFGEQLARSNTSTHDEDGT